MTDDIATIREALDYYVALALGPVSSETLRERKHAAHAALGRVADRLAAADAALAKCKEFLAAEAVRAEQAERERDEARRQVDQRADWFAKANERVQAAEAQVKTLTEALRDVGNLIFGSWEVPPDPTFPERLRIAEGVARVALGETEQNLSQAIAALAAVGRKYRAALGETDQ